ncbi:MAG: 16S rRNA (guanine(527)-N(7))-methyltransferase RsmG [Terriglobales bacterium]
MDAPRITALLEPFLEQPLSEPQLDQVSIYIDLLLRWNARINLTAIRNEPEIVTRHFGESFFLASQLFPNGSSVARALLSANPGTAQPSTVSPASNPCPPSNPSHPERSRARREAIGSSKSKDPYSTTPSKSTPEVTAPRVLDIGSGAGFPALPIKIWAPHIHLTMIESNHKKAAFLREAVRALTLTDVNVITDRAEVVAKTDDAPHAEVVTLRAVENLNAVLHQAVTFLVPTGSLALLVGTAQLPSLAALKSKSIQWQPPISIPQSHSRVLLLGFQAE